MKTVIEFEGEKYTVVAKEGTEVRPSHVLTARGYKYNKTLLETAGIILVLQNDYDGEGTPMVLFSK